MGRWMREHMERWTDNRDGWIEVDGYMDGRIGGWRDRKMAGGWIDGHMGGWLCG